MEIVEMWSIFDKGCLEKHVSVNLWWYQFDLLGSCCNMGAGMRKSTEIINAVSRCMPLWLIMESLWKNLFPSSDIYSSNSDLLESVSEQTSDVGVITYVADSVVELYWSP